MLGSLTVISLLSSAVFAQSSGSATSTASLIPSGASAGCSTFLTNLNSNTTLQSCISPIVQASAAYAPGSSSTPSSSALDAICSASICDAATFRSVLSSFASSCSAELTSSPIQDVITLYDVVYIISPMKTALCAKSDSGGYCALPSTSTSSSADASASGISVATAASNAQKYISTSAGAVNTTAFSSTNVAFMFLQSSLTSAQCTTCTRNILTSYINWESNCPYAPGLSKSVLLSGQTPVYNAVTSICGSNFLSGAVQAAGGLGTGSSSSNGSGKSFGVDVQTIAVLVATVFMASIL